MGKNREEEVEREKGKVAWLRHYGASENGGLMYVEPKELVGE